LLHGVIDSPDIPLNVSRSYLQGDPNVKKINAHITKKVADKLEQIFKNERPSFEEKWESLGLFVKYGMMTDDKFLDKANKFLVMEEAQAPSNATSGGEPDTDAKASVAGKKFHTLDEYKMAAETLQKNKDGKIVILYTTDPVQQDAYVQSANGKGYKVVKMETLVDAAFINHMEMKWENVQFTRVDADIVDNLINKNEEQVSVLSKDEEEKLKNLFGIQVPDLNVNVEVKGLSAEAPPVVATRPEFMRRMKDMGAMGGGMASWYANMPDEVTLTVNGNHKIFETLLKENDTQKQEKQVRNLADLALLSQGLLKGNALTSFISRSVELMQGEKKSNLIVEL
jgi:molecular chaperone HtpG